MKILILPLLLTLLPITVLFFGLKLGLKKIDSNFIKMVLAILTISLGLVATFYALLLSIEGMSDKGIKCMTGAVVFVPLGLGIYFVGVPLLFSTIKKKQS